MLYFALFLHFYQPPTQFARVTKKIAHQSYERILEIIERYKNIRLTANFSASLTEQLARLGLSKIINGLVKLAEEGRVELTGSAAYHPLLPKIPKEEMERQIRLNEKINRKYFGKAWCSRGFFPPEMAYSPEVGEVVEGLGYKWIILEGSGFEESTHFSSRPGLKMSRSIIRKKNSNLAVFFRNRELSLAIAFSKIKSIRELFRFFDIERYDLNEESYTIVAMDGETFGHHQPGQLKFLEEIFSLSTPPLMTVIKNGVNIRFVTISELFKLFPKYLEIEPKVSTWGESWDRWDNLKNPIHKFQWKLYKLALGRSNLQGGRTSLKREARHLLDQALHSDQFWWASYSPCWHPKMIEKGARMLRDVVLLGPGADTEDKKKAQKLYNEIILTGRKLYGDKIIPC